MEVAVSVQGWHRVANCLASINKTFEVNGFRNVIAAMESDSSFMEGMNQFETVVRVTFDIKPETKVSLKE